MKKTTTLKTFSLVLVLSLFLSLCACGESKTEGSNPSKMTTAVAAEKAAGIALENWMSTKFLALECTDIQFTISKTERSSMRLSNDQESGLRWYNAYGVAKFYNDYGDLLMTADFSVVFGHDGKGFALMDEDTVVTPRY